MPERTIIFSREDNRICAKYDDFINLQESPAGFGETEKEAAAALKQDADRWPTLLANRHQIKADDSDHIPQVT
jgi:hypothetical protein